MCRFSTFKSLCDEIFKYRRNFASHANAICTNLHVSLPLPRLFPLSPLPLFSDIFQHSDRVNEFHCGRGAWSSDMFPTYFDGSLADRRFLIFLSRASYELSLRIAARGDTRARANRKRSVIPLRVPQLCASFVHVIKVRSAARETLAKFSALAPSSTREIYIIHKHAYRCAHIYAKFTPSPRRRKIFYRHRENTVHRDSSQ